MKSNWAILIAVILALLAAIGVRKVIHGQMARERAALELIPVVVASTGIPAGTTITESMIVEGPALRSTAGGFFTWAQRGEVIGKQAYSFIDERAVIPKVLLRAPVSAPPTPIPAGLRLITLPVSITTGVGGLLGEGDFVDVLYVRSQDVRGQKDIVSNVILRGVKVFRVGPEVRLAQRGVTIQGTGNEYQAVTVLVMPQEAELLAYCLDAGHLSFMKRAASSRPDAAEYAGTGASGTSFDAALGRARALESERVGMYGR